MTDPNADTLAEVAGFLDLDDLTADVDTCMVCVGLSLAAAAAVLSDDEAITVMVGIVAEWPPVVHDSALAVGQRTALAIANVLDLSPEQLGEVAATLLNTDTDQEDGTDE